MGRVYYLQGFFKSVISTGSTTEKMKSKIFKLGKSDFLKGLVIAVLTGVGTALTVPNPTLKSVGIASLVGLISYLTKNLFTNSKDEILKPE